MHNMIHENPCRIGVHLPLLTLVLTAFSIAGCNSAPPPKPVEAPNSDQRAEPAQDNTTEETGPDSSTDGRCHKVGFPFDGVNGEDSCFDPPKHYCSAGGGAAFTNFCSPDFATCCLYPTTCGPCGWIECSYCTDDDENVVACPGEHHLGSDESPECQTAPPSVPDDPACPVIDSSVPVCLDDLP